MRNNIIAIVLGAHKWPEFPQFGTSQAFLNSASSFRSYLTELDDLNIDPTNVLDLFDDERDIKAINSAIRNF
jgi:hypothetical protein